MLIVRLEIFNIILSDLDFTNSSIFDQDSRDLGWCIRFVNLPCYSLEPIHLYKI
jgi:hypothetical protein